MKCGRINKQIKSNEAKVCLQKGKKLTKTDKIMGGGSLVRPVITTTPRLIAIREGVSVTLL